MATGIGVQTRLQTAHDISHTLDTHGGNRVCHLDRTRGAATQRKLRALLNEIAILEIVGDVTHIWGVPLQSHIRLQLQDQHS